MGTKRIIIGSIIFAIGIIAWLRIWYGENAILSTNLPNATNTSKALTTIFDPNSLLTVGVIGVIIAIGSIILVSGISSSLSKD